MRRTWQCIIPLCSVLLFHPSPNVSATPPVSNDETECYSATPITENLDKMTVENVAHIELLAKPIKGDLSKFVVTPTGETLVITTPTRALIHSLSSTSKELLFLSKCRPIAQIAISANGSRAILSSPNSMSIELLNLSTGSLVQAIPAMGDQITSLALDSSGTFVAWATSRGDGTEGWIGNGSVYVYSLQTNSEIAAFEDAADVVTDLHFSPAGDSIVFRGGYPGYGYDLQVWDILTDQRRIFREAWVIVPAYSQNSPLMALAYTVSSGITNEFQHQIEVWDIQSIAPTQSIPIPFDAWAHPYSLRPPALALNSDGTLIASGDEEGNLTIWDARSGAPLSSFHAYSRRAIQIAFSSDDTKLITLGADENTSIVKIWGVGK